MQLILEISACINKDEINAELDAFKNSIEWCSYKN